MKKVNERLCLSTMLVTLMIGAIFTVPANAFQPPSGMAARTLKIAFPISNSAIPTKPLSLHPCFAFSFWITRTRTATTTLFSSANNNNKNYYNDSNNNNNQNEDRFSRQVRLREEAESPFRKVRYFLYFNIAAGATTSLLISISRIVAAVAVRVNTDLLDESIRNAGIDTVGLIVVAYLWNQDQRAEESRLKRATKGAEMAKLKVRASCDLLEVQVDEDKTIINSIVHDKTNEKNNRVATWSTFTTTLASFRRQRGIEKRVVIAAGGKDKIQQVMREAQELQSDLAENDFVIVPVVMPQGIAPVLLLLDDSVPQPPVNVALPVGNNWKTFLDDEAVEAISQGVDIDQDGFCIVLKKNGRVGQRTKGIFLRNLLSNVVARKEAGMDVTNI
jgi:hypothetical protein